jgi:hypothetical protein
MFGCSVGRRSATLPGGGLCSLLLGPRDRRREIAGTEPMIAVTIDLAAQISEPIGKIVARSIVAGQVRNMHPADIGKRFHVTDLHHDRLSMMRADRYSGWSGCRVGLAPTGKRRLCTAHTQRGHQGQKSPGRCRVLGRGTTKSVSGDNDRTAKVIVDPHANSIRRQMRSGTIETPDGFFWYHPLRVASPANDTDSSIAPLEEIQYAKDSYDLGLQPGRLSPFLQCPSTGPLRTRLSPWPLWCLRTQRCADPLGRDA